MTLRTESLCSVTLCLSDDIIPISETDVSLYANWMNESQSARLTLSFPLAQDTRRFPEDF